ncbi:MAG: BlaI/MecI/CopY family transcriptional regulator [Acetatifactor sp.]|nr:BlaI/MecI/CopY family transcriptional regulator [Acetatifactor sp.]
MEGIKLAEIESKFVELVWQSEPINSGDLVLLCEKELNWKKSTTYTVLRRLCQKGVLKNEGAIVTSLIKKQEYFAIQSEQFIEDTFEGSLPQFLAAFMSRKKLSSKQIAQIQKMIEDYQEPEE